MHGSIEKWTLDLVGPYFVLLLSHCDWEHSIVALVTHIPNQQAVFSALLASIFFWCQSLYWPGTLIILFFFCSFTQYFQSNSEIKNLNYFMTGNLGVHKFYKTLGMSSKL